MLVRLHKYTCVHTMHAMHMSMHMGTGCATEQRPVVFTARRFYHLLRHLALQHQRRLVSVHCCLARVQRQARELRLQLRDL